MASIKMGAIVTDIRGTLGGHVFQKGNQSRVMKTYSSPRQAPTFIKDNTQGFINNSISLWKTLSRVQKQQWNSLGSSFRFKNRFGDSAQYTGYQFFLSINSNLQRAAYPLISDVEDFYTTITPATLESVELNSVTGEMSRVGSELIANQRCILTVFVTYSGIIEPYIQKFQWLVGIGQVDNTSATGYLRFVARYGVPSNAMSVWFGIESVNTGGWKNAIRWVRATIV